MNSDDLVATISVFSMRCKVFVIAMTSYQFCTLLVVIVMTYPFYTLLVVIVMTSVLHISCDGPSLRCHPINKKGVLLDRFRQSICFKLLIFIVCYGNTITVSPCLPKQLLSLTRNPIFGIGPMLFHGWTGMGLIAYICIHSSHALFFS